MVLLPKNASWRNNLELLSTIPYLSLATGGYPRTLGARAVPSRSDGVECRCEGGGAFLAASDGTF